MGLIKFCLANGFLLAVFVSKLSSTFFCKEGTKIAYKNFIKPEIEYIDGEVRVQA